MTNIAIAARHISATLIQRLVATVLLSSVLMTTAVAQSSVIDSSTPPGLAPGAPAGSYALSDLDNINLFNGHLNFRLPLGKMSGRGSAGYTMMLVFEREWVAIHEPWQFGVFDIPSDAWWQFVPSYSPGRMDVRQSGFATTCTFGTIQDTHYSSTLTRLTFTASDGTEFELRDQLTDGKPLTPTWSVCNGGTPVYPQRGRVFVTADGAAASFISDTPLHDAVNEYSGGISVVSGYLLLRDGTRYRIDNNKVSWMRDRNGNKVSFTHESPADQRVKTITDSLNRQVTIAYSDLANNINYDQITYKGFGGADRTIRVHYTPLSQALRADYSPQQALSMYQLFPELNSSDPAMIYDPVIVSSVQLPDDRSYRFYYNHYSELARVELPTGGAIEYDHTPGSGVVGTEIIRSVTARRIYPNGGTGNTFEGQTTYYYNVNLPANTTTVVVNQLNQSGTLLSREKHYFYRTQYASLGLGPTSYPSWLEGREHQIEWLDTDDPNSPDGGTILRRVSQNWQQRAPVSWWEAWPWLGSPSNAPPNDQRIVETVTTLFDVSPNLVSKRTSINPNLGPDFGKVMIDDNNNPLDVWEYDDGPGSPGALLRHTRTQYLTSGYDTVVGTPTNPNTAATIHIRGLPTSQAVYSDSGIANKLSETIYEYDNYTPDTGNLHDQLKERSGISGLCDGSAQNVSLRQSSLDSLNARHRAS